MNKPAAKEPSMDEILSSIRQIIADDDAAVAHDDAPPRPAPAVAPVEDTGSLPSFDAFLVDEAEDAAAEDDGEALELSLDQVIDHPAEPAMMVEEVEPESEMAAFAVPEIEPEDDEKFGVPDDVAFVAVDPDPMPPPSRRAAYAGTMPDPRLSEDMAEHLLNDTARAAASSAFSRLGGMSMGAGGQTIESVIKDLLRPMLKSWLDENLPSIVERLVEREIERVSRGGR